MNKHDWGAGTTAAKIVEEVRELADATLARRYVALKQEVEEIEERLKKRAASKKKTVDLGVVKINYKRGADVYGYEEAGKEAPVDVVKANTSEKIDWKKVCEDADITPGIIGQKKPSISIKITGETK